LARAEDAGCRESRLLPDRREIKEGLTCFPPALDLGYRGADYDFITAESKAGSNGQRRSNTPLDTKRARSEVRGQKTQGQLLRDLVATASRRRNTDREIGRTLFKLLVPIEMEAFLTAARYRLNSNR
jgi:hypothetical protein